MRLGQFSLLTDENIHPDVLAFLRNRGFDVRDVKEEGLAGTGDEDLLLLAFREDRVVVTHDRDFGKMVFAAMHPMVGIVHLRPGHISAEFVIESLASLLEMDLDLQTPFVLVAERVGDELRVRLRRHG